MLISSAQALDMLQAHAPRAWCKRLLMWLVFDGQLALLFTKGSVKEFRASYTLIDEALYAAEVEGKPNDPERREEYLQLVAQEWSEEIAENVRAAGLDTLARACTRHDTFEDEPTEAPIAALLFADSVDWENGVAVGTIYSDKDFKFLHHGSELLDPEYDDASLEFELEGMAFELERIELLAPNAAGPAPSPIMSARTDDEHQRRSRIGRPPKWDWEGAIAHVAAIANRPDGLPEGAGAQAKLEQIMMEWFVAATGDAPTPSEIRRRASKIMSQVRSAKN